MLDYAKLKNGSLDSWGAVKDLPNVKVLEGDPVHLGRCDLGSFETRQVVGEWECTPGKFEYTYLGDEFCTLLAGRIRITEKDGAVHEFRAGDTFYTVRGETVTWEVLEKVRKIFFEHNLDNENLAV